jgi:hypothetical protein
MIELLPVAVVQPPQPPQGAGLAGFLGVATALLARMVDQPPPLQQALDWVRAGRPIYLYLPP